MARARLLAMGSQDRLATVLICVVGICAIVGQLLATPLVLEPDSSRYIVMGLNLAVHGVLSPDGFAPDVTPAPGLGHGGPFTAFELAVAVWTNPATKEIFQCFLTVNFPGTTCPKAWSLKVIYALEIAIFLCASYQIAWLVTRDRRKAALAVLATLLCKETFQYTQFVLTEPLFLATLALFLWAWLAAWLQPEQKMRWVLAGIALGAVALVKPAWSGLLPGLLLLLVCQAWRSHSQRRVFLLAVGPLILGYALIAVPLLLRNGVQLGLWSLSDPGYLTASLAHRLASNEMTWREWLMAWIYYLPSFGPALGEALFGADAVMHLGWDKASYYAYGRDILHTQVLQLVGPQAGPGYLIQRYIIDDPIKNAAVTLLLLMRGIFVGGGWGALAMVLLLPALWLMRGEELRRWFVIALPALGIALINAQASVNIIRYNLALIPAFSLVLAAVLYCTIKSLHRRFRPQA